MTVTCSLLLLATRETSESQALVPPAAALWALRSRRVTQVLAFSWEWARDPWEGGSQEAYFAFPGVSLGSLLGNLVFLGGYLIVTMSTGKDPTVD